MFFINKIKTPLLLRVAIAIVLGLIFGRLLPDVVIRFFVTINSIFGSFLSFIIPLIIVGLVTPAIAQLGKGAKKMLLLTALLAYGSTIFSGFFTYFSCMETFPSIIPQSSIDFKPGSSDFSGLQPFFTIAMPPLLQVMTALILSFVMGLGITGLNSNRLLNGFLEFKEIITSVIEHVIIPLLPLYIFGIFLNMSNNGEAFTVLAHFSKVIILIFILHIGLLLLQFTIAGIVGRRNPFTLLRNMLPAYATALGTSSSAATIPVTLKQTLKNGVSEEIAGFTVPLCATIHMAGSAMKITACALAIMYLNGTAIDFGVVSGFIFMLGITMIAAPGVPGGCIMAALGVLESILGFNSEMQALMIALYIAMDSFGTACNVTGDGAIAVIVNRISSKHK